MPPAAAPATALANSYIYNGGLVARNTGTIINSYATGDRSSSSSSGRSRSGGLVGWNTGPIISSYATGDSTSSISGGLVGWNTGPITASYATGNSICHGSGCYSGGLIARK